MCNIVFNFSISQVQKKFLLFKNALFLSFLNLNYFFINSDIEKIKTMLHGKCSPLYSMTIWLLSLNYSLSGSYLCKTVFAMFYICKTETPH